MCILYRTLYTCGHKHEGEFVQCEERRGTMLQCEDTDEKTNQISHWCADCMRPATDEEMEEIG